MPDTVALEKRGLTPKDYVAVSVPGGNLVQSLDSGFVDAATLKGSSVMIGGEVICEALIERTRFVPSPFVLPSTAK